MPVSACRSLSTVPGRRENWFCARGRGRLPFIANSDFHKPKHIYSWKTLIHCEKDYEAIKDCIRRNEHVAITLYRDFADSPAKHGFDSPAAIPHFVHERQPLRAISA